MTLITIVKSDKLRSKDCGKNNTASGCELSVNIRRALCPGNSKVHAWLHQFLQGSSFHLGFQVCKQFLDCLSLDLEFDQRSSTPGNGNCLPKVSEFGWKSTSFSLEKNRWYDVKVWIQSFYKSSIIFSSDTRKISFLTQDS